MGHRVGVQRLECSFRARICCQIQNRIRRALGMEVLGCIQATQKIVRVWNPNHNTFSSPTLAVSRRSPDISPVSCSPRHASDAVHIAVAPPSGRRGEPATFEQLCLKILGVDVGCFVARVVRKHLVMNEGSVVLMNVYFRYARTFILVGTGLGATGAEGRLRARMNTGHER